MPDSSKCAGCGEPAADEAALSRESRLCDVCAAARIIANIHAMRDGQDPVEQDRRRRISRTMRHTRNHRFGRWIEDPLPLSEW